MLSDLSIKLKMPHACRCCYVSYELRFHEYFGDSWSPWSICQSQTHRRTRRTESNRDREIIAFLTKLKSLANSMSPALADRPGIDENRMRTYILMAMPCPSAEPKRGNRRFLPKSSRITGNGVPMSPALTDQPQNDKKYNARIDYTKSKPPSA